MVMPYHLHMPSYFLETFTEYPYKIISAIQNKISYRLNIIPPFKKSWLPLGFT